MDESFQVSFFPNNKDKEELASQMTNDASIKMADGYIVYKTVKTSVGIYVYYMYEDEDEVYD